MKTRVMVARATEAQGKVQRPASKPPRSTVVGGQNARKNQSLKTGGHHICRDFVDYNANTGGSLMSSSMCIWERIKKGL